MTEPRPHDQYTVGGNGHACECRDLEAWAAKLQRAARYQLRQLRNDGNSPLIANYLLGQIHALGLVIDGPMDQRIVAPLVQPSPELCAWPADAGCST